MEKSNSQAGSPADLTLAQIAAMVGGEAVGNSDFRVSGACGIQEAGPAEITFLKDVKYLPLLQKSRAGAVLVGRDSAYRDKPVIVVDHPAQAFLQVLTIWTTGREDLARTGIHPTAFIDPTAMIGANVYVGAQTVIGERSRVADGATLMAGTVIGDDCVIGKDTLIYENVTVRDRSLIGDRVVLHAGVVIGADGFGYENFAGKYVKVPQRGNVRIEDDVEIGANSCVDRARFGTTVIKRGTKIDNLVQIAHNVEIGEDCLVIAQVGIAGSAKLGDGVILAGQVGVVGHVKVGTRAIIGAQSGVFTDVPDGSILLGSPPLPIREEKERIIYISRLPKLFKDFKEIQKKLQDR
ncbi:MAG: UDP-3-O-(3-hydroxymyristoyl)glucosamine N-acyltransferase [Candidatus Omnitrophica bacterium]|jgi:UDP-3-O-[3-hydroxymyristoyl] glucosamine N-acyltransferase|nr:UDP-3-O-(3-hydroxymyristoyl)glucosamine N-acyltransferase [Candidatus Omnitrophota bacterium]